MDMRLELVPIPVSDVDRAKAFYTEQAGFNADHDHKVSDEIRFVQLTPPVKGPQLVASRFPTGPSMPIEPPGRR
jgi:predicted enzyme related to lactoylglutathione lyase